MEEREARRKWRSGTQAQDDLPPQDYKKKGKDKLQEEIDAFEEAPKTLVKWIPKTNSSSTSSSTTTTPRIPIKMMWIPKKKNKRVPEGDSANILHSYHFGKNKLQEEIDAFEEAPKTLVKWIPKTTSSSTLSSTTTTPRIPIKMVWIQNKKN